MKVTEFIEQYNSAKDKNEFLSNSITKQYIKYSEKISDCNRIVKASTEIDGMFKINSPAQFMLFAVTLITKYTDIELEESMLEFFESLDELDLVNGIMSVIPQRELTAYNTVLQMCMDDFMESNRSIVSFLETKTKALSLMLGSLSDAIENIIPNLVNKSELEKEEFYE